MIGCMFAHIGLACRNGVDSVVACEEFSFPSQSTTRGDALTGFVPSDEGFEHRVKEARREKGLRRIADTVSQTMGARERRAIAVTATGKEAP